MAATLFTGTGTTQSISNAVNGVSFQPDFVWEKERSGGNSHLLYNSISGVGKYLQSDTTGAEGTLATSLTSFNSNGFTLGTAGGAVNLNGSTFIAWQWKAGGTAVSNTAGSITSSVSANTTAGFSVVTYTGNNTTTPSPMPTVGHGLGVAPSLVISKSRNNAGVDSGAWFVWTSALSTDSYLRLNTTAATASVSGGGGGTMVAPTSTVFSTPYVSGANINANNYVAYCFAPVAGYSAFGSYTGNGSADGPFVYLGFRPRWLMIKRSSSAGESWYLFDTTRNTFNVIGEALVANQSSAEFSFVMLDVLSNGFKARTTNSLCNTSGATYIYAAFAENPFAYSNAR
jgi:hypothetical protein